MLLFEFHCIGKPAQRIPKRADRKLDQYLPVFRRIVVEENVLAFRRNFQTKPHEIAFRAVDAAGLDLRLEQNITCIEVAQAYAPRMFGFRENHPTAVIEIELDALLTLLGRNLGG